VIEDKPIYYQWDGQKLTEKKSAKVSF
jgi:hypothetical protein